MYYVSPLPRGVFASQGGGEGRPGRRTTKRTGDDGKGKAGKRPRGGGGGGERGESGTPPPPPPPPHRLFTASQRPSLAYHFLISLFYHVYCNAQQEPLQRNELLCSLFTGDCDDALFSEYFFLMDANSLQNCASLVTRQKQFRTVSLCN